MRLASARRGWMLGLVVLAALAPVTVVCCLIPHDDWLAWRASRVAHFAFVVGLTAAAAVAFVAGSKQLIAPSNGGASWIRAGNETAAVFGLFAAVGAGLLLALERHPRWLLLLTSDRPTMTCLGAVLVYGALAVSAKTGAGVPQSLAVAAPLLPIGVANWIPPACSLYRSPELPAVVLGYQVAVFAGLFASGLTVISRARLAAIRHGE